MLNDASLKDIAKDAFGWAAFTRSIALQLLAYSLPDSVIIGIQGPWGAGKSTILYFLEQLVKEEEHFRGLEEALQTSSDDAVSVLKPVIVRFNPWWFSGQEDLFDRFFRELGAQIGEGPGALENVASSLKSLALIGRVVSKATFQTEVPSDVADLVAQLISGNRSLEKTRQEIHEALSHAQHPIWVLIDDVERLQAHEIRQMFALVRSVGDLPYLRYILAFDPATIQRALDSEQSELGESYIEKIVQIPFTMPEPSVFQLMDQFRDKVSQIHANINYLRRSDAVTCFEIAGPYLKSIRQMNRLMNSLAFSLPAVIESVHEIDFILLEVLKVFKPVVYRRIPALKDRLVEGRKLGTLIYDGRKSLEPFHTETLDLLIEELNPRDRRIVIRILEYLFPVLKKAEPHMETPRHEDKAEIRVSNINSFERYFTLSHTMSALDQGAALRLLDIAGEGSSEFSATIRHLFEETQFTLLTRIFNDLAVLVREDQASEESVESIFLGLTRIADSLTGNMSWTTFSDSLPLLLEACLQHPAIRSRAPEDSEAFAERLDLPRPSFTLFSALRNVTDQSKSALLKLYEKAVDACIAYVESFKDSDPNHRRHFDDQLLRPDGKTLLEFLLVWKSKNRDAFTRFMAKIEEDRRNAVLGNLAEAAFKNDLEDALLELVDSESADSVRASLADLKASK